MPGIWTEGLGESAIGLVLRAFLRSGDIWAAQTDLLCALKERFDAEGINLVYPQYELTVVSGPFPARPTDKAAQDLPPGRVLPQPDDKGADRRRELALDRGCGLCIRMRMVDSNDPKATEKRSRSL